MTQSQHIVKRQVVELFVNSTEQSPALQERFRVLHQSSLKQKMNTLFDAYCKQDEVIRLDKIEIDLGVLPSGDVFEPHFEQQMIEQLERALHDQLTEVNSLSLKLDTKLVAVNEKKSATVIQSVDDSTVEQLCYYLITGELPWWSSTEEWSLEKALKKLLKNQPLQTIQGLRKSVTPMLIKRLVLQLSSKTRLSLLAEFNRADNKGAEVLVTQWFKLVIRLTSLDMLSIPISLIEPLKKIQQVINSQQHYSQLFWFNILSNLLKQDVAVATQDLVDKSIRHLAELSQLEYVQVVELFSLLLQHSDVQQNELESGLRKILIRLTDEQKNNFNSAIYQITSVQSGSHELTIDEKNRSADEIKTESLNRLSGNETIDEFFLSATILETENLLTRQQDLDSVTGLEQEEAGLKSEKNRYVSNAGIILLWPFLTQFFSQLGLISEKKFYSVQARQKAILLLQYLGTGQQQFSEHQLLLNKILCGWPIIQPLNLGLIISKQEESAVNELLESLISYWTSLKATSVSGLRTAFIQREGILQRQHGGWSLKIERTGYDVLIDKLPWGIGLVKLPWMNEPLHTDW
ncbi:MAG: hypothetical protein GY744_15900 [Gammaproteobacteria bacterium]|nr:hypothetical protein [Gammaproteobacteria bacterium]